MWSVCWDSGEGQFGLTRGGPVSPNCHREHGQRGSVSTVINHTPSLSLPLYSFSRTFPFSLALLFTLFPFFPAVSHFAGFSVNPCFSPCFCISLPSPPFFSLSFLRCPLFALKTLSRLQSPSLSPSVLHTFTFLTCCFSTPPLFNLFHLCLSPVFAHTFFKFEDVFKLSFRLTKQTRWKNARVRSKLQKENVSHGLSHLRNLI